MSSSTPPEALRRIEECRKTGNPKLDLSSCGLTEIPIEITDLIGLEILDLSSNQISEIKNLDSLTALTVLYLSSNQISRLSSSLISLLERVENIDLSENPIEGTTITDWVNPKAILGYLRSKEEDNQVPNYHLKVNIIGEGRIGKTQLFNFLDGRPYRPNEAPTHGTLTTQYDLPGSKYKATIWDFGGQAYHHGFHHVFLRPNDFYLILWRNAPTKSEDYGYWLGTARHFSRPTKKEYTAPVVLVQNVWTETDDPEKKDIYRSDLIVSPDSQKMKKYFIQDDDVFKIDIKYLHGNIAPENTVWETRHAHFLASLHQRMKSHTEALLRKVSEKWLRVKELLDKNPIGEINLKKTEFHKKYASDFNEVALAGLLDYLEFAGNIIKFPESSHLSNYVFPNPPFLADWIYNDVLSEEFKESEKGIIIYKELEQKIGLERTNIFLAIMDEFNLIFSEKGDRNNFVIPQFLQENNSTFKTTVLELIPYSFSLRFADFFHESRIFQFISEYGKYAQDKTSYWRYGLIFVKYSIKCIIYFNQEKRILFVHLENNIDKTKLASEIFAFFLHKKLEKLISGLDWHVYQKVHNLSFIGMQGASNMSNSEEETDKLLDVSHENEHPIEKNRYVISSKPLPFKKIDLSTTKLKMKKLSADDLIEGAELSVNEEDYIDVNETLRSNSDEFAVGIGTHNRQIIKLDNLTLNLLGLMNQQLKKVFISYSKDDDLYKTELKKHFVTLIREGKVSTFDDRQLSLGGEWDPELRKKIDECDIMVCLISVDFLNTDYIMNTEIPRALEMGKTVIPIVVRPCDWNGSVLGDHNGVLKGKEITLFEEKNSENMPVFRSATREERDMSWLQVVKEFRAKAFGSGE